MIKIIPYHCYNTESLELNTDCVSDPLICSLGCSEHQITQVFQNPLQQVKSKSPNLLKPMCYFSVYAHKDYFDVVCSAYSYAF